MNHISPFDIVFEDEEENEKHVVQPDIVIICDKGKITDEGYKGYS
ncbi:hypothetical protein [Caldicellulosiruptor naganoensis]|uniref:Uncharacterized protein n=1 Tax=Caldicellulosiruptor naganoensis TaxID=29324 RepID=A0ABY7BJV8_9FIRM|nr:hypothetical protein [Caldicellulosiruptor naganoensis]WAM31629.1 hypothetical protein OTJ99_000055 [Caldicellulosiruptor naganoensis]